MPGFTSVSLVPEASAASASHGRGAYASSSGRARRSMTPLPREHFALEVDPGAISVKVGAVPVSLMNEK